VLCSCVRTPASTKPRQPPLLIFEPSPSYTLTPDFDASFGNSTTCAPSHHPHPGMRPHARAHERSDLRWWVIIAQSGAPSVLNDFRERCKPGSSGAFAIWRTGQEDKTPPKSHLPIPHEAPGQRPRLADSRRPHNFPCSHCRGGIETTRRRDLRTTTRLLGAGAHECFIERPPPRDHHVALREDNIAEFPLGLLINNRETGWSTSRKTPGWCNGMLSEDVRAAAGGASLSTLYSQF